MPKQPKQHAKAKPAAKKATEMAAAKPASTANRPTKLPSGWAIFRSTGRVLKQNWKLFTGITLIYAILNLFFVRGFTGISDLMTLRAVMESGLGTFAGGLGGFVVLLSSSGGTSSPASGVYQILLTITVSLAVVWALRQVLAGATRIRIRDGFYQGMYPVIPVILLLLVICLQLLPLIFGAQLYATFLANGIAGSLPEIIFWGIAAILLAAVSVYFVTSSIFALYIATLPDMTPAKALRTARGLVKFRRWSVLRKLLFLPFILTILALVVCLPCVIFLTPLAPWLFLLLLMVGLPIIHTYLYLLYRELLA